MKIETVVVFNIWDFDCENKKLFGFDVFLLNAIDRIEIFNGKENINIDKEFFEQESWFQQLYNIARGK